MRWVDSHCHLDSLDESYVEGLLSRARAAGLVRAVVIGQLHPEGHFGNALQVRRKHPDFLSATLGVHPHEASRVTPALWDELVTLCRSDEVVAVGEAGLDYYYDHSPRDVQQDMFRRQCQLANELKKPLVVHVRDAHKECQDILKSEGVDRGVIHCFSGNTDDARNYIELGFHLSISGIVTYKKTEALGDAVRWAPLDRLLVETDSPYLAPIPHRGKKNEPAFVVETGKKVAELKSIDAAEVAEATSRNAARVFGFAAA